MKKILVEIRPVPQNNDFFSSSLTTLNSETVQKLHSACLYFYLIKNKITFATSYQAYVS